MSPFPFPSLSRPFSLPIKHFLIFAYFGKYMWHLIISQRQLAPEFSFSLNLKICLHKLQSFPFIFKVSEKERGKERKL